MPDTPVTDFYDTVRLIMGDLDADVRVYPDAVLASAVKSAVRLNKLPGYAMDVPGTSITPGIVDPNKWALVVYHVAKLFASGNPSSYSFKTRAISESFGDYKDFIGTLELEIWKLENGTMFTGWQSYYSWLEGMYGLPLVMALSDVKVKAPFQTVSISQDGVSTSS